jgi:hypothetical protein
MFVAEGAGETALAAELFHCRVEEGAQLGEYRRRLCATRGEALCRLSALDVGFDRKQPRDHFERLRRGGRVRFDMDVVDLAARMRPTGGLRQRGGRAGSGIGFITPGEACVGIGIEMAATALEKAWARSALRSGE